jgi:hypothetical protein
MPDAEALTPFVIGGMLIVVHLAVYLVSVRFLPILSTERAVIRYHFAFVLAVAAAAVLAVARRPDTTTLAWTMGLVAMTGVYSLSFAILWSLSEGSYSLAMIARLRESAPAARPDDFSELRSIGAAKQETRIRNMARLRLLEIDGARLRLATRGRWVVTTMRAIRWLTNTRQSN